MEKKAVSRFMGNVMASHELMPRLGTFFKKYPLLKGSRMADRIITKYKGATRLLNWDEHMMFLAHTIELLFDLHATWAASNTTEETPEGHSYKEGNVAQAV